MNTISDKELNLIAGSVASTSLEQYLALELLALRKEREAAVPVGEVIERPCCGTLNVGRMYKKVRGLRKMEEMPVGTKFYTAPPTQPVAVPECFVRFHQVIKDRHHGRMPEEVQKVFDECAAMIKQPASNSPVIPDGWKLVPVEPTENMVIQGFESEPDEFFSKDEDWEIYQDMSGCEQAAHRAKLCWAAMLAAAPGREG